MIAFVVVAVVVLVSAFAGAIFSPYYDSLLVKLIAKARTHQVRKQVMIMLLVVFGLCSFVSPYYDSLLVTHRQSQDTSGE